MTVRLASIDLVGRVAVVRVADDGRDVFPHVLRGALAAMLAEATWHVVVARESDDPLRHAVTDVLDQARRWAAERDCRLSVTRLRDLRIALTVEEG